VDSTTTEAVDAHKMMKQYAMVWTPKFGLVVRITVKLRQRFQFDTATLVGA
jgi:hypothetical protein